MSDKLAVSKEITPRSVDFSKWYIDIIRKADLMDYTPVRGCMVFKPDGYAIWENIKEIFDKRFKETGHRNAYFPMLIPESFFQKEKDHVEGFSPELPWVTEVADQKLEERLALRPTSETMIGYMYSKWIQSYRDLPILLNQWANVFRWEKRTLPFIRTSEILWQEGHTAHATEEEARQETMQMLELYGDVVSKDLAMPVCLGQKTPSEKFAGAVDTYSLEIMMQDGKSVQTGTSHYMGQNFSKAFDIKFLNKENNQEYAYTTSWGQTTRLIGAMIMVHSDDKGLVLPPRVISTQVVIVPIGSGAKLEAVIGKATELRDQLQAAGLRVHLDTRRESPGWKFNDWEMRGIPVRIELGPRDLANEQLILARRDNGEKMTINLGEAVEKVTALLDDIQQALYQRALKFHEANAHQHIDNLEQLQQHIEKTKDDITGWALAGWCGNDECEAKVKEETSFTSRNIPLDPPTNKSTCIVCKKKAEHTVWWAKAY